MKLDIYINYGGTCEEAFHFYEQHVGGRMSGLVRQRRGVHEAGADAVHESFRHAAGSIRHVVDVVASDVSSMK